MNKYYIVKFANEVILSLQSKVKDEEYYNLHLYLDKILDMVQYNGILKSKEIEYCRKNSDIIENIIDFEYKVDTYICEILKFDDFIKYGIHLMNISKYRYDCTAERLKQIPDTTIPKNINPIYYHFLLRMYNIMKSDKLDKLIADYDNMKEKMKLIQWRKLSRHNIEQCC